MAGWASNPLTSGERQNAVEAVCRSTIRWAAAETGVDAVGLAGSWAREAARMDSDVDIVVVVQRTQPFLDDLLWAETAVGGPVVPTRTRRWGVLTERRVGLPNGLEVEFGLVLPQWAAEPVDGGTARVVRDGFRVLHDPSGILGRLVLAVDRMKD